MENKSTQNYGPVTRDIYNTVGNIICSTCEHSIGIIESSCIIPDGFVKIPSNPSKGKNNSIKSTASADKVKDALCTVLPAGLSALGLAFNAPAVAVVVMTGAGGIVSSFIQRTNIPNNTILSELHLENIDLERLTSDKVAVHVTFNQKKKEELLAEAINKLEGLCSEISAYEEKNSKKSDVEINQEFGEWVQKFLIYADTNKADRKLYNLRIALINCLSSMNIHVYDQVQLKEDGTPDVPIRDYLYDKRKNNETEYMEVSRPAIYSNRALLARGEIL